MQKVAASLNIKKKNSHSNSSFILALCVDEVTSFFGAVFGKPPVFPFVVVLVLKLIYVQSHSYHTGLQITHARDL